MSCVEGNMGNDRIIVYDGSALINQEKTGLKGTSEESIQFDSLMSEKRI